jgi:hypothetical protein
VHRVMMLRQSLQPDVLGLATIGFIDRMELAIESGVIL